MIQAAGGDMERLRTQRMADLRYVGQGFEVTVALPDVLSAAAVQAAFEARYRALFNRTAAGRRGATGHIASVADGADPGGAVQRDAASPDAAGAAGEGPANGRLCRGRA